MKLLDKLADSIIGKKWQLDEESISSTHPQMCPAGVLVPSQKEFIVGDKFNTLPTTFMGRLAQVKIFDMWWAFKRSFYPDRLEEACETHFLCCCDLKGRSSTEFGYSSTIKLSSVYSLLKQQGNGEEGPLLTRGFANGFRVVDDYGLICTVILYVSADGWCVGVESDEKGGLVNGRLFYSQ